MCCFQHSGRPCLRIKARNVGCNAAIEQLNVLREIPDVAAEGFRRPLLKRCIIHFDLATKLRPNAHQRPCKGRLAGSAGAYNPQPLPLRSVNETSLTISFSEPGAVIWT